MSQSRDLPRFNRRRAIAIAAGGSMASLLPTSAPVESNGREAPIACDRFAGLEFTPAERQQMLGMLDHQVERLRRLRAMTFENDLPPAETFDPRLPGWTPRPLSAAHAPSKAASPLPRRREDIAFAPAWLQSAWLQQGVLKSRELVDIYLERISARAKRLSCFVEVYADAAREQAELRDKERTGGRPLGPLHGLPFGLKDLIDSAGDLTTWGAEPYRNRRAQTDAEVVTRLRRAGAILLAKTTCGAIAYGDQWFGGRTRNPWNVEEGSSGSSAGSAASVADGLCSFAIGTETLGSIMSPAARCGVVGLRPTFGRVPRTGAMALCWSLDKIGALTRSVEDMAPILAAITGPDLVDPACIAQPLGASVAIEPGSIRVGFRPEWFEAGLPTDRNALAAARAAGFQLTEVEMPTTPVDVLMGIIAVESAAAFESLTLGGGDDQLAWQADEAWPNVWRATRFEPAIGYVQTQRLRRRLMQEFARTLDGVDAILYPNDADSLLAIGNYTGHPALALPSGLLDQPTRSGFVTHIQPRDVPMGTPTRRVPFTISLLGHLFDESRLLAIGSALERQLNLGALRPV